MLGVSGDSATGVEIQSTCYFIKSCRDKTERQIELLAAGHLPCLPEAAVGMGRVLVRRMHSSVESQCWSNEFARGSLGTEVCKSYTHILLRSMHMYRENPSHDKVMGILLMPWNFVHLGLHFGRIFSYYKLSVSINSTL